MGAGRRLVALILGLHAGLWCCQVSLWSQSVAPVSPEVRLIPAQSRWRFVDTGEALPPHWPTLQFDDQFWPEGDAPLGYGEGDEGTVLGFGPDPFARILTTYLRKTFFATNASSYDQLLIDVSFDDGVVGYLNGRELFRLNLPNGVLTPTTPAITNVSGSQEKLFTRVAVPASGLMGTNVFALELHQATPTSPDLRVDLAVTATNTLQFVRGPYLQMGTTNSAIVRWRTAVPNPTWLSYGTNASDLTESVLAPTPVTNHLVRLTGLASDTQYFYRVGSRIEGTGYRSGAFRTDARSPRPTRIWAIGDAGTHSVGQRAVRDAYLHDAINRETDVWLMLGDNAYGAGTDAQYQSAVFDTYAQLLAHSFLWPALGNHDAYAGPTFDELPYHEIFTLPANGETGGVPSGTEKYYSFNWANIHFVCLDSMTSDRTDLGPMSVWLRSDLAQNDREWLIAYWHHPPYSAGSHNSDVELELVEMRENIVPILEAHGVDLVLSGHSHSYERSYLLHGHYGHSGMLTAEMLKDSGSGRPQESGPYRKQTTGAGAGEGAVYVVAGSAGQVGGGTLNHPVMQVSLSQLGSLVIDVHGSRLDARFLRSTGALGDSFTIQKPELREPFRILTLQSTNGMVVARWNSLPGRRYQIESTSRIDDASWVPAGDPIVATDATSLWSGARPSTPNVYYRVVELP